MLRTHGRAVALTAASLLMVLAAACSSRAPAAIPTAPRVASPSPVSVATLPATVTLPPASPTIPAPTASPTPAVLIAAGDVAGCDSSGDEATADLIDGLPGTVAMLGDSAYDAGTPKEFADCYDPTWGRFKDRTRPAVGNHEYLTAGASGYFDYFGAAAGESGKGYYSYELGAWHIVVLNSMCWEVGGCAEDDPQAEWLRADLAAHPALCTLAYWHFPRYSTGPHGNSDVVDHYWDELYGAGAEVLLTGHDHHYERFAPLDDQGREDMDRGLREFVVGTGGFSHYPFPAPPAPGSEVRDSTAFGVLVLRLYEDRYEWEFVPIEGKTFTDSGAGACHS